MARDAGRQLPFADEVPPAGPQGPHPADRQAPGARTPLGVRAGVRVNREPRIAACGLGLEPGVGNRWWMLEVLVRRPVGIESTGYWLSLAHRSLPLF